MASRNRTLKPLRRARRRRAVLPWYFDLSGKGLFVLVVLGASLLGLLALAQTGRVVAMGHQLRDLQKAEKEMRWEQEDLLAQIAAAADPAALDQWAREQKMVQLNPSEITAISPAQGVLARTPNAAVLAEQP